MASIRTMTSEERAKWSRAIHRAMRDDAMPALRSAYAMLTPFVDEHCATMYTDGRFRVGISPDFFTNLTDRQAAFLVMHETMHNTQRHRERHEATGAGQMRWNIAADLEVNSMLAAGVAHMQLDKNAAFGMNGDPSWLPKGVLLPGRGKFQDVPPGLTAEAYLTHLKRVTKQDAGDQSSMKAGDGADSMDGTDSADGTGNAGSKAPRTYAAQMSNGAEATISLGITDVVDCVPEAGVWDAADKLGIGQIHASDLMRTMDHVRHDLEEERRCCGRIYGRDPRDEVLRIMLAAMESPKVDWRGVLRRVVGSHMDDIRRGRDDYSLVRPNRRRMYDDSFVLPSFVSYAPKVLYAIDTSGSMEDADMQRVLNEAQGILRELGGRLECVAIDVTAKGPPQTFASVRELCQSLRGGGGTDMSVALRLVDALPRGRRPDMLVIATDGYWSWRRFEQALSLPGVARLRVVVVLTNKEFIKDYASGRYGRDGAIQLGSRVTVVDAT